MCFFFQRYIPKGPASQINPASSSSNEAGQKRKLPDWMSSQGTGGTKKSSKMIRKNSLFAR